MHRSHTRRGSAMVIAAALIFILGSLAISLTETTVGNFKGEVRRTEDLALAMASGSAANIALDYLQRNSDLLKTDLSPELKKAQLPTMSDLDAAKSNAELTGTMGIAEVHGLPIGARWCYIGQRAVIKTYVDGLPRLDIVPLGTPDSMTQDVYFVRAWATRGSNVDVNTWRTRRVEMLFVPYPQEVFVRAMFAHKGYDFQGDADTDSWDSSVGGYDPAAPNHNGTLGSEGDIYVQKPANIGGEQNINDFINFPLPPVEYDATVALETPDILTTSTTFDAGTYRYSAIALQDTAQLTINGAVKIYVDGPVSLSPKKTVNPIVYADAASRLTLIQNDYKISDHPEWSSIDNSIDQMNGGEAIGDIAKPERLLYISSYSGNITFNGGAEFGGVLFMPNATLKMNGNFDFYGSVIADAFATKALTGDDDQGKVMGTFSFHYDENLSKLKLPLPARIGVVGWYTNNAIVGGP
jgi:hypothetical protein